MFLVIDERLVQIARKAVGSDDFDRDVYSLGVGLQSRVVGPVIDSKFEYS